MRGRPWQCSKAVFRKTSRATATAIKPPSERIERPAKPAKKLGSLRPAFEPPAVQCSRVTGLACEDILFSTPGRGPSMTYRPRPLLALPLQILAVAGPNSGCDQYRTATLVRSVPVALARPTEAGTMEWAIEVSLAKRHWTVLEHSGNSYRARLSER